MIRRLWTSADGTNQWLLIPQQQHAALAADLAEGWIAWPLEPRREVLETVRHHDDGWQAWDSAPQVDPQTGTPLAFNEMELADSLSIWRGSIAAVDEFSGLAAYAVAGHFFALLVRFDSWKKDGAKTPLALEFFSEVNAQMGDQLASWQSGGHADWTAKVADRAVEAVQFFDAISLWLCCSEPVSPRSFALLSGQSIEFRPVGGGKLTASPWPWAAPNRTLTVTGRTIDVRRYADAADLASAPSEPARLTWRFEP